MVVVTAANSLRKCKSRKEMKFGLEFEKLIIDSMKAHVIMTRQKKYGKEIHEGAKRKREMILREKKDCKTIAESL